MRGLLERFNEKYTVNQKNGCWEWVGAFTRGGYGHIYADLDGIQGMKRAHRVSFFLFNGAVPKDKCVLHTCDNPACVNPDHLSLGTMKDNMADKVKKGRHGWGVSAQYIGKEAADEIRKIYSGGGKTQKEIGIMYGIKPNTVSLIINHKRWKENKNV